MTTRPLRGIHVFWIIFIFFAIIIAVDTTFVVRALNTFPGEQVENSYVLGLDYNREVSRREKQAELGWRAEAGLSAANGDQLVVRLKSRRGEPVTGLMLSAILHRAGTDADQVIQLSEGAAGEYTAPVRVGHPSRIELSIVARKSIAQEPVFEAQKVLVVS